MEIEENIVAVHSIAQLGFVLRPINMIVELNFVAVDLDGTLAFSICSVGMGAGIGK